MTIPRARVPAYKIRIMSSGNESAFELGDAETVLNKPLTALTLLFWVFILVYAATLWMPQPRYGVLFVGGSMLIYILSESVTALDEQNRTDLLILLVCGAITIICTSYVYVFFWELFYERPGFHFSYEYAIAVALVLAVTYLSYRAFGVAFAVVIGAIVLYGYAGPFIPGIFGHGGLSSSRLLGVLVLDITGFYGSVTRIIAAWVSLFLLYAGLIRAFGAFDLILRLAAKAANRSRSGVAQFALFASVIIGSINGSPSANAAMTGSFTIPMMKDSGLPDRVAAAVEAVASTTGQITPPIMGAAAFVMASLLGISYVEVLIAGILPAIILISTVSIAIHYTSIRNLSSSIDTNSDWVPDNPRTHRMLVFDGLKFLIPFGILIYTLGVAQWTIMTAAMITSLAQLVTGLGFPVIEDLFTGRGFQSETVVAIFDDTIEGFRYGAIILAPIGIIIALINGVIDIIAATGLPGVLTLAILDFAGGVLLIAGIICIFICILLGLGMPSVAAYTIVAILVAPTLIEGFLVADIAAHYFVFYSAIIAFITPPIATAVVVASGVAGSDFWRTCLTAARISAVLFVLPLVFLYNPAIVGEGPITEMVTVSFIVILGGATIIHGLNYPGKWGPNRVVDSGFRTVYVIIGVSVMVYPDVMVSIAALAVAGLLFVSQYFDDLRTSVGQIAGRDSL